MKIGLIGAGKTGNAFAELAKQKHSVEIYGRENPPRADELRRHDALVIFLPAAGLADHLTEILEAKRPVVCGTTGFDYSEISQLDSPWIVASNFSLGMNLTFLFTRILSELKSLPPAKFHVHEIHHTAKKDIPSGTALYLQRLLPSETEITAERIGNAKGLHRVQIEFRQERIQLEHEALDRSVFGAGALYALENLLPGLPHKLHRFEELLEQKLRKEISHGQS